MAFSFGGAPGGGSGGNAQAEIGPELSEIITGEVGFKGVDRDCHIRFLPTPWPSDALPPPTSSLMTVAPTKGIIVGGGPDGLVVATTKSVRAAISTQAEEGVKLKPFQAQGRIPLPSRPLQVAFCAAESALAVSTESGDQLVIYETATLLQENPQPQISIPTNGALRAMTPNPAPANDSLSSLLAMVTVNGDLLVSDLKAGSLNNGPSGPVLKNGVASVAWSNKGKQLVAGLADGTIYQLDPHGDRKAEIPHPPGLEGNKHVSSISWLENDVFFAVYTSMEVEDDVGMVPSSEYYIIQRRKQAPFLFQKLPEVCAPFGLKRAPAYHFLARLKDFKPHLQDALIVSSTASTDLALVTKSTEPLTDTLPATEITNVFTLTSITDEVRRATLPMTEASQFSLNQEETSTIGLGVDLSSTESVDAPLLGGDIAETATPQPNVLVLNHEGILLSWWFIYSESIRQKTPYHSLSVLQSGQPAQQTPVPAVPAVPAVPSVPTPSGFGSVSGFGSAQNQPSAFGQSGFGGQLGFGSPQAQQPAFGKPSFGSPSSLGAVRQPAFGAPSILGAGLGLGSPSALSSVAPAFGGTQSSGPAFGQPSSIGQGFSAFASPSGNMSSPATGSVGGGGFSAFSNAGGFATLASSKPFGESPFAKTTENSPFGQPSQSILGGPTETSSAFGAPLKTTESSGAFETGTGGFVLGSSFKPDEKAIEDETPSSKPSGTAFSLGESFGNLLSESANKASPSAEVMDDNMDDEPAASQSSSSIFNGQKPSQFGLLQAQSPVTAPLATSEPAFGPQSQMNATPAAVETSRPTSLFGIGPAAKQTSSVSPLSSPSEKTVVSSLSLEREQATPIARADEPPLPPDATSRAVYGPGDTSASSNVSKSSIEEDAPLPPDFTKKKPTAISETEKPEDTPLPPDFLPQDIPSPPIEKEPIDDAPLPPDFLVQPKKPTVPTKETVDDAPFPPDFLTKFKTTSPKKPTPEDTPLPPDFIKPKRQGTPKEEPVTLPDETGGSEGDFEDSGEEISHDISPPSEKADTENQSFKFSPESSFGGPDKTSTGGLFTKISVPGKQKLTQQYQPTRQLFGEIQKPNLLPSKPRSGIKSPRSRSPVRPTSRKDMLRPEHARSISAPGGPNGLSIARKATTSKLSVQEPPQKDLIEEEESRVAAAEIQRLNAEAQSLSSDDEDEKLRAELARPLSPVPTLDPFQSRQEYAVPSLKAGIPGQIERLYRDINSMVDTLGINSRSIASFVLYQEESQETVLENWAQILLGENPSDILDEKLSIADIGNLEKIISLLDRTLQQQRLQNAQDKLDECQKLLSQDIFTLRGQCASIQKTLDSHIDNTTVRSAPLSAEQVNMQHDLRKASTTIQSQLADLEQAISLLRAKIADSSHPDSMVNGSISRRSSTKKPTVEAVTSTIATMMSMAESKSSDIDVLEAQMKRLGLDISGIPGSCEGSPFTTPLKKSTIRVPVTPGSDGPRSAYHTPESISQFRSSSHDSTSRYNRLRSVHISEINAVQDSTQWKARTRRRKEIMNNLKKAAEGRQGKVRSLDDL